jgi:Fic/DOC family
MESPKPLLHVIKLAPADVEFLQTVDCWKVTLDDYERLAQSLLGASSEGWLRSGSQTALIHGGLMSGSLAAKLAEEVDILIAQTQTILSENGCDSGLRAAAYYHLRFERIHPLRNGNGRVGRTLLATQCGRSYGIPIVEAIAQFEGYMKEYKRVFAPAKPEFQFELLVDLLARVFALPVTGRSGELPLPIAPNFPDPKPIPPNAAALCSLD